MKLKAPQGAGDPCVAGVVIAACDGVYEVEAEIGALLIESFGFIIVADEKEDAAPGPAKRTAAATPAPRRGQAAVKNAR